MRLPPLAPFGAGELEPEGDYDGLEFRDLDLARQQAHSARFLDCALYGCVLDDTRLTGPGSSTGCLSGSAVCAGTDLARASLRELEVRDVRMGGVQLPGSVSWSGCS